MNLKLVTGGPPAQLSAGLCSPGLWPPEQRFASRGVERLLHAAFKFELDGLGKSRDSGLEGLMADLASGRVAENPFPVVATGRLRDYLADVTRDQKMVLPAGRTLQDQPVDVLLLGGALRVLGDPDSEAMLIYATGVPVGLGVEMPRTPRVFPPTRKWSLKQQPE